MVKKKKKKSCLNLSYRNQWHYLSLESPTSRRGFYKWTLSLSVSSCCMRFFFFCLQDKNSPSIWHAYHVSKRHTSYFLNAGRRATGEEEEERRGELMRKFSLNLSTVSPYVSPAYCLPHRTFTSVPFFFFGKDTQIFWKFWATKIRVLIVLQRKRRGEKKSPSLRMMQVFHSPAAASSSSFSPHIVLIRGVTSHIDLFCSISHIGAKR